MTDTNALGQPLGPTLPGWTPPALPGREPLVGRYCRSEPLDVAAHAASLHAANALDAAGQMWTYLPYGPFANAADYRAWTAESCRSADPLFHAIVDQATGRAVGVASFMRIDPRNGAIEVGHL